MLPNKVSPASLCGNTKTGHPEMMLGGHGLAAAASSGGEESQQSQASLFNSGSELANSMELFSQPYSCSSASQHNQTYPTAHTHQLNRHTGTQSSQDEGHGIQNVRPDNLSGSQHSQNSGGHNKYYMRYLSAVSLSSKWHKRPEAASVVGPTPLATEGKNGDTAHSRAAFEAWKTKQQDRLEKQQLIKEIITSAEDNTKELNNTLQSLRLEIREALSSPNTGDQEKSQAEALTRSILSQMMQGQAEIKQQLTDLNTLCSQQKSEIAVLQRQVSTLERAHTTTLQSTLTAEIARLGETVVRPCLNEVELRMTQLSEQVRSCSHDINRSKSLSEIKEEDSGLGDTLLESVSHHSSTDIHPTSSAPASSTPVHTTHGVGSATQGSQPRRIQIKRKRKSSCVTRDHLSRPLSASRGGNTGTERTVGGVELALSQGSTEGLSTPCDIDLTQHSPSGCSQIISQNLQKLRQQKLQQQKQLQYSAGVSLTDTQHAKRRQEGANQAQPVSPPRGPVAKKKRSTAWTNRQKPVSTTSMSRGRGRVAATPKGKRRSQRLSKLLQDLARAERERTNGDSSEDGCVELSVKPSVNGQSSVDGDQQAVQHSTGGGVDMLNDWLDSQSPLPAPQATDTKPVLLPTRDPHAGASTTTASALPASGRFQRSSEAARRRLVVTEKMSSTLAGSDSVLRELFLSAPSLASP